MSGMERLQTAGVSIAFEAHQRTAGTAIAEAVERTQAVLSERWKLTAPDRCEVRVLSDGVEFVRSTAPSRLRWLVGLTAPLWRSRVDRAFRLAGGWTLPWPGQPAVGIKPPELLPPPGSNLGDALFVPVPDPVEKVKHVTCHELTHAFTAHLRLPPWLNEGLAMRAVDRFAGEPTVLAETRTLAESGLSSLASRSYGQLDPETSQAVLKLYATGYWLTRRIDERRPQDLLAILARRRPTKEVNEMATAILANLEEDGGADQVGRDD